MRISDWSSDVCSSDIVGIAGARVMQPALEHRHARPARQGEGEEDRADQAGGGDPQPGVGGDEPDAPPDERVAEIIGMARLAPTAGVEYPAPVGDRKGDGWGKSVSVRLNLGGGG